MNKLHSFITLEQVSNALQYRVTRNTQSSTKYLSWQIEVRRGEDEGVIWEFAHEIGHAILFRKEKRKVKDIVSLIDLYKKRSKLKIFIYELEAWLIGFLACKLFNIGTKGMLVYAIKCLKTYL
ncbi:hypothetical protein GJU41_11890 [Bacillus idriensis]|uniref:ImmA/IrrE family metallo-endopeptidase n=1 Tax=Metabacillus idriensis TaxID=324768 RepID=A0A6I2MBE7_9BACI|nr:hypothetical protein [Metabacillus idriensis]MRX54674.1 hypothetical protein [Metabacillus idriensis]